MKLFTTRRTFAKSCVMSCIAALAVSFVFASTLRAAPDTSTPKAAALAFAKAVMDGDLDTAKSLSIGTDAEFNLVKMMSDMIVSVKKLSAAAAKKFGDEGKLPGEMSMDLTKEFGNAEEKIDGDHATLILKSKPDDKFPPTFKKVDGGWKIELSALSKDPEAAAMSQMMPAMTKAFQSVTADIEAGKFKNMQEAMMAIGAAMAPPTAPPAGGK